MKKLINIIIGLMLVLPLWASTPAQNPPATLTWYGLDYTQVKFIGYQEHFNDLYKIQNHYFSEWNHLILSEASKYDVAGAFGVSEVKHEIEHAINRSRERDMSDIIQQGSWEIGKSELAQVVKAYINPGEDKIGAIFVMESLNKLDELSTLWLVVFNVSGGDILHVKRYMGKPGGFGFRNYWARGYYNVLLEIKENPSKPF